MAEILVRAFSSNSPMGWKEGMIVDIQPDGFIWGKEEGLPKFWHIHVPLIPENHPFFQKLMERQEEDSGVDPHGIPQKNLISRRTCVLTIELINVLSTTGELTIKAASQYHGSYDYTIQQVKNYFWDKKINSPINIDL